MSATGHLTAVLGPAIGWQSRPDRMTDSGRLGGNHHSTLRSSLSHGITTVWAQHNTVFSCNSIPRIAYDGGSSYG